MAERLLSGVSSFSDGALGLPAAGSTQLVSSSRSGMSKWLPKFGSSPAAGAQKSAAMGNSSVPVTPPDVSISIGGGSGSLSGNKWGASNPRSRKCRCTRTSWALGIGVTVLLVAGSVGLGAFVAKQRSQAHRSQQDAAEPDVVAAAEPANNKYSEVAPVLSSEVLGPMLYVREPGYSYADHGLEGGERVSQIMTEVDCVRACKRQPSCNGFSWAKQDGICWLKSAAGLDVRPASPGGSAAGLMIKSAFEQAPPVFLGCMTDATLFQDPRPFEGEAPSSYRSAIEQAVADGAAFVAVARSSINGYGITFSELSEEVPPEQAPSPDIPGCVTPCRDDQDKWCGSADRFNQAANSSRVWAVYSTATSAPVQYVREDGFDYRALPLEELTTANVNECILACSKNKNCNAFTYDGTGDEGACFLLPSKSPLGLLVVGDEPVPGTPGAAGGGNHGIVSGMVVRSADREGKVKFLQEVGVDYWGNDIEGLRPLSGVWNVKACATKCYKETRCNAFQWESSQGLCFLKSARGNMVKSGPATAGLMVRQAE